jgi:hypothetical protein
MESKSKCDRRAPCSRCFSKNAECVYKPPTRKGLDTTWTAGHSSIAPLHQTEHSNSPSCTPSHLNRVSSLTHSYSNYPTVTSYGSFSSASTQTLELQQRVLTHGIDYTQDSQSPKGNQPEADLTDPPVKPFVQASLSAPILSDYSLNQYVEGYLTGYAIEAPSPTSPSADDQSVLVSCHSSSAQGSGDTFSPSLTSLFPNEQSCSDLAEVFLNTEKFNVKVYLPEDFTPPAPRLPSDYTSLAVHDAVFSPRMYRPDPYVTLEMDRGQPRLRHINPDPTPTELQQYCTFTDFL